MLEKSKNTCSDNHSHNCPLSEIFSLNRLHRKTSLKTLKNTWFQVYCLIIISSRIVIGSEIFIFLDVSQDSNVQLDAVLANHCIMIFPPGGAWGLFLLSILVLLPVGLGKLRSVRMNPGLLP